MLQPLIKESFMKQLFKIKYFLPFKPDLPYFKNYTNSAELIFQYHAFSYLTHELLHLANRQLSTNDSRLVIRVNTYHE